MSGRFGASTCCTSIRKEQECMHPSATKASPSSLPLPPGPPARFWGGNMREYSRDPLAFMTNLAREYGDIALFHFGRRRACLLNHPAYIEQVLVTNQRSFRSPSRPGTDEELFFGRGLLTSNGDAWLRQRRLAQPAFHRERIAAYGQMMVAFTERMIAPWRVGETRDIHRDIMRLTLEIAVKTLFDADITREATAIGAALDVTMERFASPASLAELPLKIPTPGNLRFKRAVRDLERIIYELIRQRRADRQDRGDLLTMLVTARDEAGDQLTDQQVRDEVMTLLLAGHETTALALSWAVYLLAQHPECAAHLQAELQSVLGNRPPTVADVPRLRYTAQVINESLRLYPPIYIMTRAAAEECVIGGYALPPGTRIGMSPWVMHRDPRYYPAPERFNPDRWAEETAATLPRFAFFPFGGGPRLCIGQAFAMMEAVLVLATIAQQFRPALVRDQPVALWPSLTLRPKGALRVVLGCP